jgi:putative CocE/NonD family hydrolase
VQIRTDFPRRVRTIEHLWIPLPDGCRLAARIWLPDDAESDPVPAILDAVPYRKGDGTAAGDAAWMTYFAGHGYAGVRIDLRGSGEADGLIEDEYSVQEAQDVDAAIAWLAEQSWCSGAVGMIGMSWGGFAALQAAARNPPALRGIVPIHASDDRYADDVHYIGGCVLATDMVHWSTCMAAYVGQPPDPAVVGDGWREAWRERVEGMEPWVATWLAHQRRDDYWRQGSACEDYARIACPVFAVGGWVDGYRDMVLRVLEHVDAPVRGLIGPWGHTSPEHGAPGPAIGFLQECVRFFDHALKGAENGFFDEPALVSFMQERIGPVTSCAERPGRWVADAAWPSPNVLTEVLPLGAHALGVAEPARRTMRGLQLTGLDAGVWCGDGGPADLPADQRPEDGASLCWDSEPVAERTELLGHAAAVLELEVDRPLAAVVVRLCDVAPDGSSSLIARGVLNLTHREGHDRVDPLVPGEPVVVRVPMQSTSYAVPAGHVLRLAVSPTYWPWVWPSPEPVTLTVVSGGESRVELPVRTVSELDAGLRAFGAPESAPALSKEYSRVGTLGRTVHRDLAAGTVDVEFPWIDQRFVLTESGMELAERNVVHYRLTDGDPLSAAVDCEVEVELARGDWRTRVAVRSSMTCDRDTFLVTTELDAYEGAVRSFARTWTHAIPRDGG